ncbi:hypothetical protein Hanom_Chr12g01154521 [Helianthus anomalus]
MRVPTSKPVATHFPSFVLSEQVFLISQTSFIITKLINKKSLFIKLPQNSVYNKSRVGDPFFDECYTLIYFEESEMFGGTLRIERYAWFLIGGGDTS